MAPKVIEVSEDEWNASQRIRDIVAKAAGHPKAKLLLQEAHKLVDPQAPTPDLDREAKDNEKIATLQKAFDDYKAEVSKKETETAEQRRLDALKTQIDGGLEKVKRERRYTDEGIAQVRKIMDDEGILKAELAADIFEKRNPSLTPTNPRSGAWNFLEIPADENADGAAYSKKLLETTRPNGMSDESVLNREIQLALNAARA